MRMRRRIAGLAAGAAGLAAAGTAVGIARQQRVIARRGVGDATPLGSLRSAPITVVADDGVPLHVEVDEVEGAPNKRGRGRNQPPTLVFVHGFALTLDCWHFQRAGFRGLLRTVYYDQRSHGRSGRSERENATIDQLGRDLLQVLDQVVPDGPVVLVGHSMGGMTILALAEEHPELFGNRITGVALIATTAGALQPHKMVVPFIPDVVGSQLAMRGISLLSRVSRTVDGARRVGKPLSTVLTDRYAFGSKVPASYVDFTDQLLGTTPFEVVAEFFPSFGELDKFAVLRAFDKIATTVLCGTRDKVTPIEHSRKLAEDLPHAHFEEVEGAGHMVIMERHERVNAILDQLIAAASLGQPEVTGGL